MDYLIGARAFAISKDDALGRLVEYGRRSARDRDGQRAVTETRPVGLDCHFPRSNKDRKRLRARGTARSLSVRYQPPSTDTSTDTACQATVSGVHIVQDDAPSTWAEMLNSRGTLFSPVIADETRSLFVLDNGAREDSDLNLVGVAERTAADQVRNKNRGSRIGVRASWTDRSVEVALLDKMNSVATAHILSPPIEASLLTAMSIVADLAFVSWLTSEARNLSPDIMREATTSASAFATYIALDELQASHRRSSHIEGTERLLSAFGSEEDWTRLGTRIVMASLSKILAEDEISSDG